MPLRPTTTSVRLRLLAIAAVTALGLSCGSDESPNQPAQSGGTGGTAATGGTGTGASTATGGTGTGASAGTGAAGTGASAGTGAAATGGGSGGSAGSGGTGGAVGGTSGGGSGGAATGATGGGAGEPVGGAAGLAGGAGTAGTGGAPTFEARQYYSSETEPFDLAHDVRSPWRDGPLPIAYALAEQATVPVTMPGGTPATTINVDPSITYQEILGFGISMEEASVSNVLELSQAARAELLTSMLDPVDGMGQNLFRITMGTSDFTGRPWYSYDDVPSGSTDPNMDYFSIQNDIDYGIVEVLQQMLAINPDVKFAAAPWSPPGWMKDSGSLTGGGLRSEAIPALALYFRRFVEAYRDQGIPVYAVSLQNEPFHSQNSYPTCFISAQQETELVKAMRQQFTAGGLDTQIWVFDHNFDIGVAYAQTILSDPDAAAATDGVAWHDYGGEPTEMTRLHELYPNMDIYFTEKTLWGVVGLDRVAQYLRNWAKSYMSWLTMLDQDGLPNNGPNTPKLRRFVKATTYAGAEYWPTAEHYLFGLYSKFVVSGAVRIESDYGSANTVTNVSFLNPDGTVVAVVMNQTDVTQDFALATEGNQIWAQLPGKTAATYVWHAGLGPSTLPAAPPPG